MGHQALHNGRSAAQYRRGSGPALPDVRGQAHLTRGAFTGTPLYVNAGIYIYIGTNGRGHGQLLEKCVLEAAAWPLHGQRARTSARRADAERRPGPVLMGLASRPPSQGE